MYLKRDEKDLNVKLQFRLQANDEALLWDEGNWTEHKKLLELETSMSRTIPVLIYKKTRHFLIYKQQNENDTLYW